MTYLAVVSKEGARLFLRLSTIGHVGLLPLLFRPQELILKILLCFTYLTGSIILLELIHLPGDKINTNESSGLLNCRDMLGLTFLILILVFSEVLHPLLFKPKRLMEFLPLMMISTFCAMGLMMTWIHCGRMMLRYLRLWSIMWWKLYVEVQIFSIVCLRCNLKWISLLELVVVAVMLMEYLRKITKKLIEVNVIFLSFTSSQ